MVKLTKENFGIKDLQKFCEENELINNIKTALNVTAVKDLIKATLPEGKMFLRQLSQVIWNNLKNCPLLK